MKIVFKDSPHIAYLVPLAIAALGVALFSYVDYVNNNHAEYYKTKQPIYYDSQGNKVTEQPADYEFGADEEVLAQAEETFITGLPEQVFQTEQTFSTQTNTSHTTEDEEKLIMMDEIEAWTYLTNGKITDYPSVPYYTIKPQILELRQENTTKITVPIWYWANPGDETDMSKISTTKDFEVNVKLAGLFQHIFQDIYSHPSKPVINIADGGMGTWVTRGKNHSDYKTVSAHALGGAIDINPSTGTFNINGTRYGNGYKNKAMSQSVWEALPESHKKYHVLYIDCPIVTIFKSYGFYWGGDWKSGTDPMHLAFIGDGSNARSVGQDNYKKYSN